MLTHSVSNPGFFADELFYKIAEDFAKDERNFRKGRLPIVNTTPHVNSLR